MRSSTKTVLCLAAGVFCLLPAAPSLAESVAGVDDGAVPVRGWSAPPFYQPEAPRPTSAAPSPGAAAAPAPFVAVTPCRILDTRGFAPPTPAYGAPSLLHQVEREFQVSGSCGIPAGALAVSANATVTGTGGAGYLALWQGGGATWPGNSTRNWTAAGSTLANAAVLPLGAAGTLSARTYVLGTGITDFLLDVNGYYSSAGIVNSLSSGATTLTGAVALAAGSNVSITPSGNAFTVAASAAQGATGPTGPTGATGPAGPAGPTGPAWMPPAGTAVLGTANNASLLAAGFTQTSTVAGTAGDGWTSLSTANAPPATRSHTAVWTGSKMIVWGGQSSSDVLESGGI